MPLAALFLLQETKHPRSEYVLAEERAIVAFVAVFAQVLLARGRDEVAHDRDTRTVVSCWLAVPCSAPVGSDEGARECPERHAGVPLRNTVTHRSTRPFWRKPTY